MTKRKLMTLRNPCIDVFNKSAVFKKLVRPYTTDPDFDKLSYVPSWVRSWLNVPDGYGLPDDDEDLGFDFEANCMDYGDK
jgi:hypothetical protein